MAYLLLCLAVVALLVLAATAVTALVLWDERHELDVLAQRLAAEQRVDHATRTTLKAMRDVAQWSYTE